MFYLQINFKTGKCLQIVVVAEEVRQRKRKVTIKTKMEKGKRQQEQQQKQHQQSASTLDLMILMFKGLFVMHKDFSSIFFSFC